MPSYQVIGKSIPRADAKEKVTGSALYVDDLRFPRTLYLKVLRAGVPHAKIISMNTEEAESMEGVYKVISRDTEGINTDILFGTCIFDQPPMAFEKVRHAGEVVAAVIAKDERIASEAVKKIRIEIKQSASIF